MAAANGDTPFSDRELETLFLPLLGRRVALCVSGGADSVALMHLVARWSRLPSVRAEWRSLDEARCAATSFDHDAIHPQRPLLDEPLWMRAGAGSGRLAAEMGLSWPPVVVLTVDHGLRPEAADEAELVKAEAGRLGLPHQTLVWTGPKPATGIQEAARDARYRLLFEAVEAEAWAWRASRSGFGALFPTEGQAIGPKRVLVTAHHLEDQAETVLMRLARGTGLDGLSGMRAVETFWQPPTERRTYRSCTQVLRPLLGVSGQRLRSVLVRGGIAWREDPSNQDTHYERVRIRGALPVLAELGVAPGAVARSASRLALARENVRQRVRTDSERVLICDHGGLFAEIDTARFRDVTLDQGIRVLRYLLAAFGGAASTADLGQVSKLTECLRQDRPFEKKALAGCILAPPTRSLGLPAGRLLIWREVGRLDPGSIVVRPGEWIDWDGGRFRVSVGPDAPGQVAVRALGASGWRELRQRMPSLKSSRLPAGAPETLPAIWDRDRLLAVPWFVAPPAPPGGPDAEMEQEWQAWAGHTAHLYLTAFTGFDRSEHEFGMG